MLRSPRTRAWCCAVLALALGEAVADAQEPTRTFQRKQLEAYFTKPQAQVATPLKLVRVTPLQQVQLPTAAGATIQVAKKDLLFRRAADVATVMKPAGPIGTAPGPGTQPAPANPRIRIPWEFVSAGPEEPVRRFVPYLQVENGGLVYSGREGRYRGTVTVGVMDELAPEAPSEQLEQKVTIQFALSGPGEVRPRSRLDLDHTGVPFDSLTVSVADTASLRAMTQADLHGVAIPLPTRPLAVRIVVQPSARLVGLGLSRGRVRVQPPPELAKDDTLNITLSGPFDFDRSEIAAPGGEASFRIGLPGHYEIQALLQGRVLGRAPVDVDPPWTHLIVMLAGAVLAALARLTQLEGARDARAFVGQLGKAVPFALIFGLGGALGVDWFGWKLQDFASYAAIFLLAAVGGWGGAALLERKTS